MSNDEFFDFCLANSEWQTENRIRSVSAPLYEWAPRNRRGRAFDSSTGLTLPNGAIRSPDACWVSKARMVALTADQKQKFAPVCPEFVVEVKSPSDSLPRLRRKMHQWIENGALLGWLILPDTESVQIFRPGWPPETRPGNRYSGRGGPGRGLRTRPF